MKIISEKFNYHNYFAIDILARLGILALEEGTISRLEMLLKLKYD